MLGQPISMLIPKVVGFKLTGALKAGVTATDLVLTITQQLRAHGVVGKFVEFYGEGLGQLSLADRATIANMAPEYGATCGFFPIDEETLHYLHLTGRDPSHIAVVEAYAKAQGLWHDEQTPDPLFDETLELDMAAVEPSMAGPKRPQDRVVLKDVPASLISFPGIQGDKKSFPVKDASYQMTPGDVVIAAITSCTNTSNPSVIIAAGLLAKKAVEQGLSTKPWVKSSFAPGSQVVTDYLNNSGLQSYLDQLGFNLVGYGCTTCIGNSGPLAPEISQTIEQNDLTVCAVLSGNRNFEGRINPLVKANYLASPPLVVAYALLGNLTCDITKEPIGINKQGKEVYLSDIWPSDKEIQEVLTASVTAEIFSARYSNVFAGDKRWQEITVPQGKTYLWEESSTYVKLPPYFDNFSQKLPSLSSIKKARCLAVLGDSITTDHISPAGSIKKDSPAGKYLLERGIGTQDFNSYGARRGNHEVMMRGTFANIRLKNEILSDIQGGMTEYIPSKTVLPIYDAAMLYAQEKTPLVVVAGKEYGTGSSRDWAAKGTFLLGVKAVIAESFERIHRSNLVGMGVLPLVFTKEMTRKTLRLTGQEFFTILGIEDFNKPRAELECHIERPDGSRDIISLLCRIDTMEELEYFRHGGILPYVLRHLAFKN
jgi:aconitate hydratase